VIDLDELERLREASTPGPYEAEYSFVWMHKDGKDKVFAGTPGIADARYLAALANAAPELIRLARERQQIAAHDEAERRAGR
jgi:hypothetical protein